MAIKLEILTENKEALRGFNEIRDAVVKTSNLLEQIAKDMGKFGKAGTNAAKETDRAFDQANQSVSKLNKEVDKSTASFDKLAKAAGAFFTLQAAKGFAEKIFAVRQEIESLQTSFRILVGDKDKADQLFQGIKEFATSTPMQMKDLASAAQTMMGFGIPLEQIMENLKAIGDVSMGDAQRFQGLALSFSQMSAAGKLMGQDLMQMINAGFNPLATMSEKTGKSIGVLKDEMSKGAISADMVRQAFIDATSEGGKFNGMLEAQSKTLAGAYSNLLGAIDDMLNDIGDKMQGTFTDAIDMATHLAKNYEQVGKVILTLVAAFGAYKAALMVTVALQKSMAVASSVSAFMSLAKSVTSAKDAMALFNLVTKANPIGLVLSAVAAAATAFALFGKKTDDAAEHQRKFNEVSEKATANVKALYATLNTASKSSKVAADTAKELKQIADEYGITLSSEAVKIGNETKLVDELNQKREQLIDTIRREAIERERANQQKGIEDTYASSIEGARSDMVGNLSSKFSAQARGVMSQLITEEDLQKVGRAKAEVDRLKASVGEFSPVLYEARERQKALTEELITKVRAYAIELGKAEGDERKYASEAKNMSDAVYEFLAVTNESVAAQDAARVALANATLATTGMISVQDAASTSADVLHSRTVALIDLWNSAHPEMTFTVHFDDSEIPAWMKGMTTEQLKKSLAARQQALSSGKKVQYGSRTFGNDEGTAREAAMLDYVLGTKTKKPTTPTTPTTTPTKTKTKKTKPTKNTGLSPEEIAEKKAELELRNKRERERAAVDLELSTREAEIQAMKEGTAKTIKQIELDRDKELEAIERAYEDLKVKRIEEAKALWDADPKNKKKNFYTSDAYKTASADSAYTTEERENRRLRSVAAWSGYLRSEKEIKEAEKQSWRDYLKEYGDYQQKRQAIKEEYADKIDKAQNLGDILSLKEQEKAALRTLDEQFGVVARAMADLFADASKKSVTAIQAIIDKYEALVKYLEGNKGTASKEGLSAFGLSDSAIEDILSGKINIKDVTDRLKELKGELKDRSPYQSFIGNMKAIVEQLEKAKNAADVGEGISAMTDNIKQFLPAVKEFGSNIANIFGADDSKLNGIVDGFSGLMSAGSGVGQIMSGDIVGGVMNTVQGISAMVDAFDGLFGADYSSYKKLVEEYENLISVWDSLIEKKKEYISESYGVEAAKAGKEAESLVQKELEAWRALGRERLNAGISAGSHSIGVRTRQKMTAADWANVGYDLGGRLEGLFDLSSEQLQELKENAPTFWAKLDDEVRKYLENIIKGAETLEDIQEQTQNQLTSTTFDNVYDNFVSSLSDMDKSAYDFSKDFEKYMFNAVLNAEVGNKFKERLKTWYANFAESTKGGLSDDELAMLKAEYDTIVREGVALRDELAKVTGYGSSGEGDATFKSVSSFTQEQGDVLNGRLTAIQIAVQNGNLLRQQMVTTLGVMSGIIGGSGAAMDDMRDLMAVQNTHLEDIVTLNKRMLSDFGEKMDRMNVQLENKL